MAARHVPRRAAPRRLGCPGHDRPPHRAGAQRFTRAPGDQPAHHGDPAPHHPRPPPHPRQAVRPGVRLPARHARPLGGTTPEATLVRPDGYVAWAGDHTRIEAALVKWCGPADHSNREGNHAAA
ncbi:hypothetical protein ACIBQX_35715 [Nonomuraea sp. NPDC049714]|uniref:aromatic-ring hydroxylase C-terminal domain-containing protein n=1 Tax=Nonomuraea sp. NPDC049714 TaxID=3364357 RepID=UPI003791AAE0